jgi:hypothetical protein
MDFECGDAEQRNGESLTAFEIRIGTHNSAIFISPSNDRTILSEKCEMPNMTYEVKSNSMDLCVVWLRDQETNERWWVEKKKVSTVERLRFFCEHNRRYSGNPDRSPGFLRLLFKKKPLLDDYVSLDQLGYPEYHDNSSWFVHHIEISPLETKTFHITCPKKNISLDIPCHARVLVWDLRGRVSAKYGVSPRVLKLSHEGGELNGDVELHSLPTQNLRLAIEEHCFLSVKSESFCGEFLIWSKSQVLDFISLIQAKLLEEKGENAIRDISVFFEGQCLPEDSLIGDIFPNGRGSVSIEFRGELPPDRIPLCFRFPSGPVYNISLPSHSRIPFLSLFEVLFDFNFDPHQRLFCPFSV